MIHCRLSDGHTVQVNSPSECLFAEIDSILPDGDFLGCQCSGSPHFCVSSNRPSSEVSADEILGRYDCFGEKFGYASLAWSGRIIERVLWHSAGVCSDGFSADDVLTIFWTALDLWGSPEALKRRGAVSAAGARFREHIEDARRFFQSLPESEEKFRLVDAESEKMQMWLAPVAMSTVGEPLEVVRTPVGLVHGHRIDSPVLTVKEKDLLAAAARYGPLTGEKLCRHTDHNYDGHAKQLLSNLVKMGLLTNHRNRGYQIPESQD